ncbi:hypothetical protein CHB53_07735, partial [Staphylococcus epidermidis]
ELLYLIFLGKKKTLCIFQWLTFFRQNMNNNIYLYKYVLCRVELIEVIVFINYKTKSQIFNMINVKDNEVR